MILKDLYGKRVCIVGFGREGRSALNALKEKCEVTIADKNEKCETNLKCQTGENYLKHLEQFDVIVKSPGVPPCTELDAVKDHIGNGIIFRRSTTYESYRDRSNRIERKEYNRLTHSSHTENSREKIRSSWQYRHTGTGTFG